MRMEISGKVSFIVVLLRGQLFTNNLSGDMEAVYFIHRYWAQQKQGKLSKAII
jgi:hypothetical protein